MNEIETLFAPRKMNVTRILAQLESPLKARDNKIIKLNYCSFNSTLSG